MEHHNQRLRAGPEFWCKFIHFSVISKYRFVNGEHFLGYTDNLNPILNLLFFDKFNLYGSCSLFKFYRTKSVKTVLPWTNFNILPSILCQNHEFFFLPQKTIYWNSISDLLNSQQAFYFEHFYGDMLKKKQSYPVYIIFNGVYFSQTLNRIPFSPNLIFSATES